MKKNNIVIDACVFLKLFLDEENSDKARTLLQDIVIQDDIQIIVPNLFIYEVIAQISKTDVNINDVFECFEMYKSVCLTVVDLDPQTSIQAKDITKQGHPKSGYLSFYDSVYHALAIENNCDFITADGKHEGKVKELGHIKVLKEMNI